MYAYNAPAREEPETAAAYIAINAAPEETMPSADTLSGNYLAGRFAQRQQDWDAAQNYINAVTDFDQDNKMLLQRAFLLSVGAGQHAKARTLAEKVLATAPADELALIYLACDALSRNDFQASIDFVKKLPSAGFGQYTKPLLSAWAMVGMDKKDAALKILRQSATEGDPTFHTHAAMIEEMTGSIDAASDHYKASMSEGLTPHSALFAAQFFRAHGQEETANKIFSRLSSAYPFIDTDSKKFLSARPSVTRPAEGAGIALFDLASLLYEKRAFDSAQIYGSLVQLLMPKSPFTLIMMGDLAALHEQNQKAISFYEEIPAESPLYWLSRTRIAEVYETAEQPEMAVTLLEELAKTQQTRTPALIVLGDFYRRQQQYDKALGAYDQVLTDSAGKNEKMWPVFYARGMSLERLNDWSRAEKDLLTALEFQPDNPMILNFIGYSWAEKGINLDKALDFTKRAADMRPDDGYILDSYGWALYRSGNYAEAVKWLQRSVEIIPDDPAMLDHLGDAYWKVGRKDEAHFKWKSAHDMSKDTTLKQSIEKKISLGLDDHAPQVAAHKDNRI